MANLYLRHTNAELYFLKHKFQTSICCSTNLRPLSPAAQVSYLYLLQHKSHTYLLQHKSQISISCSTSLRPLFLAAQISDLYLLQNKSQTSISSSTNLRPLSPAVQVSDLYLLQHKSQTSISCSTSLTPLYSAVQVSDLYLLQNKSQTSISCSTSLRPLYPTAQVSHLYILQYKSQTTISCSTSLRPLYPAAQVSHLYVLQNKSQTSIFCSTNLRPLSPAVQVSDLYLLQHKSQTSISCSTSLRPLYSAVQVSDHYLLQHKSHTYLLQHKSHTSMSCSTSLTPLSPAAQISDLYILQYKSQTTISCSTSLRPLCPAAQISDLYVLQHKSHTSISCSTNLRPLSPAAQVLPGLSWDNLRNVESAPAIRYNYSMCRLTDDGHFLIPDNVFIIPLKRSKMQTFAELIDEWKNFRSVTAKSINANAGFQLANYAISGTFSKEYAQVKGQQIEDKSATIRIQLRYHRYKAKLRPGILLSPEFKSSLLGIATHLEMNQTDRARYESEVLVRSFGTHYLTSVTAGAGLVKEDYVKRSYVEKNKDDRTSMLMSANGAFQETFSMTLGPEEKKRDQFTESGGYLSNLTHSYTETLGGDVFLAGGMTASDWAMNIDSNLVAMDRTGDPLFMLITQKTLPELPLATVELLEAMVRDSINLYYKMNVIPGCTDRTYSKFSVTANFDDGSCKTQAETGLALGGIYQMCESRGEALEKDPCGNVDKRNALTGEMSCPAGFVSVLLHEGNGPDIVEYHKKCSWCNLMSTCCETIPKVGYPHYKTYWCSGRADKLDHDLINVGQRSRGKRQTPTQTKAQSSLNSILNSARANSKMPDDKLGYSFGGVYTHSSDNLVTNTRTCPEGFYPREILLGLNVCISDEYDQTSSLSIPFGGFFSCSTGNPLASVDSELERKKDARPLEKFLVKTKKGVAKWPKKCPTGYSQHLAIEVNGCAIHYCAESGAIRGTKLPNVRRPPFSLEPPESEDGPELVFDQASMSWTAKSRVQGSPQANVHKMSQQSSSSFHTVHNSGPVAGQNTQIQRASGPASGLPGPGPSGTGQAASGPASLQAASGPGGTSLAASGPHSGQRVQTQRASGPDGKSQEGYMMIKSDVLIGVIVAVVCLIAIAVAVAVYVVRLRELREKKPHTEVTPLRAQGIFSSGFEQAEERQAADANDTHRSSYTSATLVV
ncbi:hypothetical protein RRG08_015558 [Elysia crispata]|uniref:MACPF domain-containing protein n=1 Tax=Elysia crispata TaxID=231223 RepID=A0AAE1D058_9GAST|nr:hypothetical protein RRG08_015558 [Elysia crispata]